ncbi:TPA: Ig-like domain repeat protein, partial [Pseudomonas putida]|nr:Ig-like domain repeat protein [Pseudomonas putida]
ELSFDVPNTPVPESPSDLVVAPNGASISGTAPIGSEVEVRDANGNVIGSVVVGADGTFVVALTPPQANGEQLDVVAIDADGNSSLPVQLTAPDITAPAIPTELAVSADGSVLTGRAEPGSTVRVVGADGAELGNVLVGPTGIFSIALDPPLIDGEALQVSATDAQGNTSGVGTVNAPDIDNPIDTTAPVAPTNLLITSDGRTVSGRGEAGTTVKVLDADGNVLAEGTVLPDGTFSVQLPSGVTDGSALQVILTDAAGNVSQPGSVTSPDLQAPAQPADLTLTDGTSLTGSAEANARVEVRDAAGNVIGSGTVGPDGSFTLSLDPAQANGEALD